MSSGIPTFASRYIKVWRALADGTVASLDGIVVDSLSVPILKRAFSDKLNFLVNESRRAFEISRPSFWTVRQPSQLQAKRDDHHLLSTEVTDGKVWSHLIIVRSGRIQFAEKVQKCSLVYSSSTTISLSKVIYVQFVQQLIQSLSLGSWLWKHICEASLEGFLALSVTLKL